MTNEEVVLEEPLKPFITIDDVRVYVEDLPEEGQQIFGRLQRLNQKKANVVLDLEELQAGINFFSNRIVAIYNDEDSSTEETQSDLNTEEN
mgnify:FL=1|jgi:hypothetical protein|tara:strand:+ start:381 stop:653 length:273 start_codon:yes stop_codon:yes gene_type:complete